MVKKKVDKNKPNRPKKYEASTLAVIGTLDDILKASVKLDKKSGKAD